MLAQVIDVVARIGRALQRRGPLLWSLGRILTARSQLFRHVGIHVDGVANGGQHAQRLGLVEIAVLHLVIHGDREHRVLLPGVLVVRQPTGRPVLGLAPAGEHVEQRFAFPPVAVPLGLPAGRDFDQLDQLADAASLEDDGLVAELRPIDDGQRGQVKAIARSRRLLQEGLPPRIHRGGRIVVNGQHVVDRFGLPDEPLTAQANGHQQQSQGNYHTCRLHEPLPPVTNLGLRTVLPPATRPPAPPAPTSTSAPGGNAPRTFPESTPATDTATAV